MSLDLLLAHHVRTGDPEALAAATLSLDAMASGGIYDHLGGGFARYSTDDRWLVPHFEKMLYDQALLVRVYLHAWLVTGEIRYRQVVDETIGYVLRDLTHPAGGFFAAEDADSEGVEGRFYVWSIDEVRAVCGADADAAIDWYGRDARTGTGKGPTSSSVASAAISFVPSRSNGPERRSSPPGAAGFARDSTTRCCWSGTP